MPRKTIELLDQMKKKSLLQQVLSEAKYKSLNEINTDNNESILVIYLLAINASARLYDLSLSESIIKDIPSSYPSHPYIQNALMDMWISLFNL